MADTPEANAADAEKAYAAAAAEAKPTKVETPAENPAPVVAAKVAEPIKKPVPARRTKIAKPAAAPVKSIAKAKAAKRAARVAKAAAAPAVVKSFEPKHTLSELKDKIMATAKTTDFSKPIVDAVSEFQTKAKAAYDKGTEAMTEATEFAKGNVEAMVASGKILAAGAQTLGKGYVAEAKSAYETMTGDMKDMAAVKSPTELFQLQGKIARRNFDMFVAMSSKHSEAMMKLANDTFLPLTGRVNIAAEKLAKVA